MEHREHWISELKQEICRDIISSSVAEVPVFRFVSKLSGGGVVTRVLQSPETELAFWGKVKEDSIRMVQNIPSKNISPYQPIVHVSFEETEKGTRISILLRPHKQASMFGIVEAVGAVLCVTAGLLTLSQSPLAGLTIVFGISLALFPWIRARKLFGFEKKRCLEGLEELKSKLEAQELEIDDNTG